jgi:hypothetical protein
MGDENGGQGGVDAGLGDDFLDGVGQAEHLIARAGLELEGVSGHASII